MPIRIGLIRFLQHIQQASNIACSSVRAHTRSCQHHLSIDAPGSEHSIVGYEEVLQLMFASIQRRIDSQVFAESATPTPIYLSS